MTFKKATVGMWTILVSQIILLILYILLLTSFVLVLLVSNMNADYTFTSFVADFVIILSEMEGIVTVISYVMAFVGIILASTEVRKFRSAMVWGSIAAVLYLGITVYNIFTDRSMDDVGSLMGSIVMMVISVTCIEGCISIAEKIRELKAAEFYEKCVKLVVISYMATILMSMLNLILTDANSFVTFFMISTVISQLLCVISYIFLTIVLVKTLKMLRLYKEKVNAEEAELKAEPA